MLHPAQESLRQNERRLQAVLDTAGDVITVVNRGGEILAQSQAVQRVLGYEPDELVGENFFKFIHEEDVLLLYSSFFNVIEGFCEHTTTHFRHRTQDGSYRMIEATMGKLHDASYESVVFSMRPITGPPLPVRVASIPRETADPPDPLVKDRFLAMLSHELRTPLTPILLGVNLLQEDQRFAEAMPMLVMIRRNVELQSRLLEELSDFTEIGHHKVRLRLELLDAHQIVRFVLENCQSEIAAGRIEMLLDLQASENMVMADSAKLQRVMWNLVRNAVKFSSLNGSISIASTNGPDGSIVFEFTDHGIGIEPELLPLVFNPYQQGDRMMQQFYGGLGLGLFIAIGLTEAQGGTLTVTSKGRGQGATFRLSLKTAPTMLL